MATLTTTATYQNGVLLPKIKPTFEPKEVVVVYVSKNDEDEEVELSPEWEQMLLESQEEIRQGKILGPFTSAEEAIKALRS